MSRITLKSFPPAKPPPRKRGRQPIEHYDRKGFIAWWGLYRDAEVMALSLSPEGYPDKAATLLKLHVAGQRLRDLADKFERDLQPADKLQLAEHWKDYATARGWPITDETFKAMMRQWPESDAIENAAKYLSETWNRKFAEHEKAKLQEREKAKREAHKDAVLRRRAMRRK